MGIILFACANEELTRQVKRVLGPTEDSIKIITTSRATVDEDIQKVDKEISLVVSRGSLGQYIAARFPYHVILMRISLIDILKNVTELKAEGAKKIAVIASSAWADKDFSLCDEQTMGCTFLMAETTEERLALIESLRGSGFDALITVGPEIDIARQYGLKVRTLITTETSIIDSYKDAKFMASVIRSEQLRSSQVRFLLDNSDDALVLLGREQVSYANTQAKNLFGTANISYQSLTPYLEMRNTTTKVGDVSVLVNSTVYSINQQDFGHIISFKDISNIHKSEQIVRRSQQKGFVAKASFGSIIYESVTMKHCIEDALQYAQFDSNVLIIGETGTGKELFAQSIHNASPRRNQPFVSINCAAIPPNLLESELFGYVDGAFTGAKKSGKYGVFELANNGTLFLDEIGEMPLELQSRLLRVLQEKELMRIGDDKIIPVNVRVICATNRDLLRHIEDGKFRADLYYRINVLKLTIPPLRARIADICPLFKYYLHIFGQKYRKIVQLSSPESISVLENYLWPGNIRELMNIAERTVVLCEGEQLSAVFLQGLLSSESQQTNKGRQPKERPPKRQKISRDEVEKLLEVYSQPEVCEMLGISRTTLWRIKNK